MIMIIVARLFVTVMLVTLFSSFGNSYAQVIIEPFVKISSPEPDTHVPTGNLTIYGRSSDNATTPCRVFVLLNADWPMDPAVAEGPEGKDDYSKWTYTFTPYYSVVSEGQNKIESGLYCNQTVAEATAWHSINVTGTPSKLASNATDM